MLSVRAGRAELRVALRALVQVHDHMFSFGQPVPIVPVKAVGEPVVAAVIVDRGRGQGVYVQGQLGGVVVVEDRAALGAAVRADFGEWEGDEVHAALPLSR